MFRLPGALALALVLFGGVARASQYPLDQASLIIPRADAKLLRKAGIRTTLDILMHGRTPADREALAARSGLPLARIEDWAAFADLMRVRGIGPDVARLLARAGLRTIAALQQADPVTTAAQIKQINQREHLSTNPPGAESIAFWIGLARQLPVVLE